MKEKEKEFLRKFYDSHVTFIRSRNMLDPKDIKFLADSYSEYLENSEFKNNEVLKSFLSDLRKSESYNEKVLKGEIHLTGRQSLRRYGKSATNLDYLRDCNNGTIRAWWREINVTRTVSKAEMMAFDQSMEPCIKQNELERKLSLESSANYWIG